MLRALPGAEDMLHAAEQAADLYLGVVSNKTGKYLRAEADHLGWTPLFGRLVGAQDATRDKPASDPVHLALLQNDVPPGPNVWFVGDAPIDVICGRNAGCSTVLVGPKSPEEGSKSKPDHHVADCAAFSALIRSYT